ncbi:MAG: hypothetical protein IJS05_04340 [Paludibacteraceae bacterium]|nr:hypothetical protein [Paludibacteraceae bacterium]
MFFDGKHKKKTYPLLPFSQLVYNITRWMPRLYRFSVTFVMRGGSNKALKLQEALQVALSAHQVFRMRIDWHGRQYEAESDNILHGRYHDFHLSTKDNDLYMYCSLDRILGDGRSMLILAEDVCHAYKGEYIESDNYWAYLDQVERQKQNTHYLNSKAWLEQQFADTTIPVRPAIDRHCPTTILPPKAGVLTLDLTEQRDKIGHLSAQEHLSLDGLFSLCTALAIADYCGTDSAALTWAYEGREQPEEERIFGSLHRDVPFIIKTDNDKNSLIRQARNQIRNGIAHSDYPYTLTEPHNKRWNYAVNVLRSESPEMLIKHLPHGFEISPQQQRHTAYALLDIEITENDSYLGLTFRYSATHYKQKSMQRFAALVRKNAEWLLSE